MFMTSKIKFLMATIILYQYAPIYKSGKCLPMPMHIEGQSLETETTHNNQKKNVFTVVSCWSANRAFTVWNHAQSISGNAKYTDIQDFFNNCNDEISPWNGTIHKKPDMAKKYKYRCHFSVKKFIYKYATKISTANVYILRPRQNSRDFADDILTCIFMYESVYITIKVFHWRLLPRVQLTIFQHWFKWWIDAEQATGHYLNQWCPNLPTHICATSQAARFVGPT